jgi:LytS/YehU family sensor histidine kinase
MNYFLKYKITLIGVAIGLIGGYFYYYFVGCANGTCAITSKPLNSTLYGGMMGALIADFFKKPQEK